MNKKIIASILASVFLNLASFEVSAAESADTVKTESVRMTALKEHAFGKGLASGRANKFKDLKTTIMSLKEFNDQAFQVAHLYSQVSNRDEENSMLQPPVIMTGEDMLQINTNGKNYSHAEIKYEVLAPARFVSSQLNWQTFLVNDEDLIYAGPADDPLLVPKNDDERKIMQHMYNVAYNEGIVQAQKEFEARVDTLTALITGMYQYHILRAKNVISPPEVASGYVPVSGNSTQLLLSNRQLNLNKDASFNLNTEKYKAFVETQ